MNHDGVAGYAEPRRFTTRTADLGEPGINLDRALQLAADLEDKELVQRQRRLP